MIGKIRKSNKIGDKLHLHLREDVGLAIAINIGKKSACVSEKEVMEMLRKKINC